MVRLIPAGLDSEGFRLPEQISEGQLDLNPLDGLSPEPVEQELGSFVKPSVASLSLGPRPGDVEANLVLAEKAITEAVEKHPSLRWVVLSELFTMGYADLGSAHRHAEDAGHGMSAWRLSALAHALGVYVAYGFPERLPGGGIANSVNLVGPEAPGPMLTYRKIHLVETTLEPQVFVPGSEVQVVEAGGARVAVAVCWDLGFPEAIRAAAHSGADLILAPAAWREPWGAQYEISCAARALDNAVYVASANQQGLYPEARFETSGASSDRTAVASRAASSASERWTSRSPDSGAPHTEARCIRSPATQRPVIKRPPGLWRRSAERTFARNKSDPRVLCRESRLTTHTIHLIIPDVKSGILLVWIRAGITEGVWRHGLQR